MIRAVLAAAAVALFVPVAAQAALSFRFDRAQARTGELVHAFQSDAEGHPAPAWQELDGVTLYLASVKNLSHRVRLGEMGTDTSGVWSVDFRVPRVRPGLYTIAFFCAPCGNTYFASVDARERWTPKPSGVLKVRR